MNIITPYERVVRDTCFPILRFWSLVFQPSFLTRTPGSREAEGERMVSVPLVSRLAAYLFRGHF